MHFGVTPKFQKKAKMIFRESTLVILLLFSLFVISQAKKYTDPKKDDREWQEFQEWKKSKSPHEKDLISRDNSGEKEISQILSEEDNNIVERKYEKTKKKEYEKRKGDKIIGQNEKNQKDPPPINEAALMARYIVNQANWTSVATISSRRDIQSFPSSNVISFSDGIIGNGSGIPYMYLTPLDFTAQDILKDSRATLMMTLAQGRYCSKKNYDPMDPRCARVILTGKVKAVKKNSAENEIAKNAVFGRHPWLENMPADHHFFFAKLKIAAIVMLDTFGGPKYVKVKDYLHPPTPIEAAELLNSQLDKYVNSEQQEKTSNLENFVNRDVFLL